MRDPALWERVEPGESEWDVWIGAVWHSTTLANASAILDSGVILPSRPDRPFRMPQTANSYALHKGYVALFDFRDADPSLIEREHFKWSNYFCPDQVVLEVSVDQLPESLISWRQANAETGYRKVIIPYFEAWSRHAIPIKAVPSVRYILDWNTTYARSLDDVGAVSSEIKGLLDDARNA